LGLFFVTLGVAYYGLADLPRCKVYLRHLLTDFHGSNILLDFTRHFELGPILLDGSTILAKIGKNFGNFSKCRQKVCEGDFDHL